MACRIRNERRRNQRTANLLNLKKKLLVVRVRTEAKSSKSVHEGEPPSTFPKFDLAGGARSPRSPLATPVVPLGNQPAIPRERRHGGDNCGHLAQKFPPQSLRLGG